MKRARFLLASTSEVYGDPQVHPQPETYWGHVNPIGPRGVYDEAKRYAEALTMAYHRQQGVDTAIVRIFNTYGPRMRPHDGRAIPTFMRQALEDKPLTVFGDGTQTRSFCYVDDLIRGLVLLAESDDHLPVNIGNPHEFTLLELAEAVFERPARRARSSSRRCRSTTRRCASPTSPAPAAARLGARDRARRGPAAHARVARQERGRCVGSAHRGRGSARRGRLWRVHGPSASTFIQKGIYDDAQILYGNPDKVFPSLSSWHAARARQPRWGGPNGVATASRRIPPNPADPAYRWATYDRTVRYALAYGMAADLHVLGTPSWANAGRLEHGAAEDVRPAVLRHRGGQALLRARQAADGTLIGARLEVDRLERAEQPGLPQAPVREFRRRSGSCRARSTTRRSATPSSRRRSR